ncbi:hypothetical protein [Streptomyces sp. NPDC058614]|uniref:hypothetical protein n=1 Tax=Streptomyces sp. NPDC058614 TaxID=3346557 RepID=UPI003658FFC2
MYKIRRKLGVALAATVAVLLAVVGVTASGAAAAPAGGGGVVTAVRAGSTASVAVNGLRLRSKPGYNGWVKGLLYKGDRVFIRETYHPSYNANWVGVVLKQRSAGGLPRLTRGYVYKSYLR